MRRTPILMAAGVVATVAVGALSARHFIGGSAEPKGDASAELTTGAIGDGAAKIQVASASDTPVAPKVQPVTAAPPAAAEKPAPLAKQVCNNPNALGVSRTIELDTTGGPGLGMSQYRDYDFLKPGEVVLTFDDGPWPVSTPAVLAALDAECVKAIFFPIGKHATWHPQILKDVIARGHSVGSHTWSHMNLATKPLQEAKDEIEKGISTVAFEAGQPISPFFRFPQLRQTADLKAYLAQRNITAFSIDIDSQDFKIHKPDAVVSSVMDKLKKTGKGIILMHDLHRWTASALPEILSQLKAGGYKIVNIRAKETLPTLPEYDAAITAARPVKTSNARPVSSIMKNVD